MMRAKKAGTATSLDMAAIDPDSDAGHADWEKDICKSPSVCRFLCAQRRGTLLHAGQGTVFKLAGTGRIP